MCVYQFRQLQYNMTRILEYIESEKMVSVDYQMSGTRSTITLNQSLHKITQCVEFRTDRIFEQYNLGL